MASIKVKFLTEKILSDGTHPIALQVIHNRKKKLFYLQHSLPKEHWDEEKNIPNKKATNHQLIKQRIKSAETSIQSIILQLENKGDPFTIEDIEIKFRPEKIAKRTPTKFVEFVEGIITELETIKKFGNAKAYLNTKGVFVRFLKDKFKRENIDLLSINENLIKEFRADLVKRGGSTNGISFQLRTLRAIINRAIRHGLYPEENYPFKNITISSQPTRKLAVNKDVIQLIEKMSKSKDEYINLFRDIFLFSFYTRGMSFVDIAYLKVGNIENGRINYHRSKTGQLFSIKIIPKIETIINRYKKRKKADNYLFPIITRSGKEYLDYRNGMRLMNKKLKEISIILKLDVNLSTYVTRHSWATIAKKQGVATAVISEGLGHTTEEITQVYLDSFENDTLDAANDLVTS